MNKFTQNIYRALVEHLREQRPALLINEYYGRDNRDNIVVNSIVVTSAGSSLTVHLESQPGPHAGHFFFRRMPTGITLDHPDCTELLLAGVDRYFDMTDKMQRVCGLVLSGVGASMVVAVKSSIGGDQDITMTVRSGGALIAAHCKTGDWSTISHYSLLARDKSRTFEADVTAGELAGLMVAAIRSQR